MMMLVSYRELNNIRKSHVDPNDKLNMGLLKETCPALSSYLQGNGAELR